MVKSVLSVAHEGLTEWIFQRISAIYMALYSIVLVAYIVLTPGLSFAEWHSLFAKNWVKVASILFILGMLYHAWIGVWTVLTDYVKPPVIRAILDILVIIMLVASFIWGVMILWSV